MPAASRALRSLLQMTLALLMLFAFGSASASATVYPNPGPMPPKEPDCTFSEYGESACARTTTMCSHIIAPAFAENGQIVVARTDPPTPCDAWSYNVIPGEQLSPCYIPAESSGYIEPYGGVGLNECKFRVDTSVAAIWHEKPGTTEFERTDGPGWTKVGIDLICGYGPYCNPDESEDEAWMAVKPSVNEPPPKEPENKTTTHPKPGLAVSYSQSPSPVLVPENAKGAEAQTATLTVTVKNTASTPIENVTFEDPLQITPVGHIPQATDVSGCAWANGTSLAAPPAVEPLATPAPSTPAKPPPPCPISETKGPAKPNVGTLAPGAEASAKYTLNVAGDGDYTLYTTISGTRAGEEEGKADQQPVNVVAEYHFQPESQLLIFSADPGQRKVSPKSAALTLAGTPFTMRVHMENRSYYRPLLVSPLRAAVTGNVIAGTLQAVGKPLPEKVPTEGSIAETNPNSIVRLAPRQSAEFELVFFSSASDAWDDGKAQKVHNGGTRGTLEIQPPEIATVNEDDVTLGEKEKYTKQPESDEVIDPAALEQQTYSFDDSAPPPAPNGPEAKFLGFSNGLFQFAWHATTGLAHGIFIDLPVGIVTAVPTFTFKYIELETTLWKDIEKDPALKSLYFNQLTNQLLLVYVEAPKLAPKFAEAYEQVSNAVGAHLTEEAKQWYAGDWKKAVGDLSAEAGTGFGSAGALFAGPAALAKGVALAESGGVLLRLAPVINAATKLASAEKVSAEADFFASSAAKEEEAAEAAAKAGKISTSTPAQRAARVQEMVDLVEDGKLPPGMVLDPSKPKDLELIAQAYGVPPEEAVKLANLAKEKGLTMVARSRGVGTPGRIAEGAYLKGPPFYAKNASPLDVSLFGWDASKVHDLVVVDLDLPYGHKPLPQALADFGSDLQGKGYEAGSDAYQAALNRYKVQWKGLNEDLPTWRKWSEQTFAEGNDKYVINKDHYGANAKGFVNMKWDATENPLDWGARPDFNPKSVSRVRFQLHQEGRYVFPQLKPLRSDAWGSITGDVDWLSFGDLRGQPLQGANGIDLLNDLAHFAAQHPQSESWVKGGLFEFDQKLEYLSGYDTIKELEAAGGIGKQTNLQFGPDGMIRTVVLDFNKSSFKDPTDYSVFWKGGWLGEGGG
jgi:hypothetical protein